MERAKISIIAAIGANRELGKDNKLLWHIPEDLKRFKQLTQNHAVIMGRKTYESIGKPLPNRKNIIISRDQSFNVPNCIIYHSFDDVIKDINNEKINGGEVFIIGGGQIFELALPYADKLYLTIVEGTYEADTFFPDYSEFKVIKLEKKLQTPKYRLRFLKLQRS